MSKEQIAHDLALIVVSNRHIDTPSEAVEEYQVMYRDILHRLSK